MHATTNKIGASIECPTGKTAQKSILYNRQLASCRLLQLFSELSPTAAHSVLGAQPRLASKVGGWGGARRCSVLQLHSGVGQGQRPHCTAAPDGPVPLQEPGWRHCEFRPGRAAWPHAPQTAAEAPGSRGGAVLHTAPGDPRRGLALRGSRQGLGAHHSVSPPPKLRHSPVAAPQDVLELPPPSPTPPGPAPPALPRRRGRNAPPAARPR